MADSSLAKKLLIKPGHRVLLINRPPGYSNDAVDLPDGVELANEPKGTFDIVHLFAKNREELNRYARQAIESVKPAGVLWIPYTKGSSGMQTDLTRDIGWEIVNQAGLENVAQVSINETWSAGRFRLSKQVRSKGK